MSLPPAHKVWGKAEFLHLFVILFTGGGGGVVGFARCYFLSGCLVPCFFQGEEVCVTGPLTGGLCPGDLYPGRSLLEEVSGGVSVLSRGGSARGSLLMGISVGGGRSLGKGTPSDRDLHPHSPQTETYTPILTSSGGH